MLSYHFHTYLQKTRNVCLYRISSKQTYFPTLFFPQATTVTLIHCSRNAVERLLNPVIFPNLSTVHYLSANPGKVDLYNRFNKPVRWLFPNRDYAFYNCMIEAGHGRVENRLIRNYIYNMRHYTNRIEVDLNLPGYGVCTGSDYHKQLRSYLEFFYMPSYRDQYLPEFSLETTDVDPFDYHPHFDCGDASNSLDYVLKEQMEKAFFKEIMKDCEKEDRNIIKK